MLILGYVPYAGKKHVCILHGLLSIGRFLIPASLTRNTDTRWLTGAQRWICNECIWVHTKPPWSNPLTALGLKRSHTSSIIFLPHSICFYLIEPSICTVQLNLCPSHLTWTLCVSPLRAFPPAVCVVTAVCFQNPKWLNLFYVRLCVAFHLLWMFLEPKYPPIAFPPCFIKFLATHFSILRKHSTLCVFVLFF